MGRFFSAKRSFSTYLVTGLVLLLVLSTLSAGVPAYWLTRLRLEQQAWLNVTNAQQATRSLLRAEQDRLTSLATLFAERPTLARIFQAQAWPELPGYLQAFQEQSQLDILLLCRPDGAWLAGGAPMAACPQVETAQFGLLSKKPALLVSHAVRLAGNAQTVATVIAGLWLDDAFLQNLATNTGLEQSILALDGTRLSSSLPVTVTQILAAGGAPVNLAINQLDKQLVRLNQQPFYTTFAPLTASHEAPAFGLELALPVADLLATESRALVILIASTSVIAVVGGLLATEYIRRLTRPLAQLTQVAERMSRGDYVAPIPAFATPTEVATLCMAFIKSQASMLRTLEEQSQARNWLYNLIQSIVEGVITFDAQGQVTFVSQGAESMTGWRHDEARGQSVNCLFPPPQEPSNADRGKPFLERIPTPGSKRQIDVVNRNGKALTLSITGARLTPPTGDAMQMALVLRDVTHEEALRHLRSYFLANISHEFKTPLSTLNASLELLLDSAEALSLAEIQEVLKPAHMSLLGLQNLIDNLLQSSSIEAGHFTIRKRPADLKLVIRDALQLVQPLLDRRRQPFTVHEAVSGNANAVPEIAADPARLTQVLVNLLVNASKYSPIGEPIDLCIKAQAEKVRIAVADRGPGILAAERINLFQRFIRLSEQDDEQYGTGLGLYVVKTTIEAHGGLVGVDDRTGGGSVFWVELPSSS